MSRIARKPITVPSGTEVKINGQNIAAKGVLGSNELILHDAVAVSQDNGVLQVVAKTGIRGDIAMAGTMRVLLSNLVAGVSTGFEKKLTLVGVGYRAQMQGSKLNLTLGFSHPVEYAVPAGVQIETPSQTEVVIKGNDKQVVGQVAADIRAFRPPEPYKGKGVRYSDEHVIKKEAKKK
jgi:large subunit ribosomal protein L6